MTTIEPPLEYHKIDTVYARDRRGKIVEGTYATNTLAYLADRPWLWTEKVDGTNVRLHYDGSATFRGNEHAYVYGRTDNAQLAPHLLRELVDLAQNLQFESVFGVGPDVDVTLYGEGYGVKIGPNGRAYDAEHARFVLFDVRIGPWWLERDNVENVAEKLALDVVPVVGTGTLPEAVELVRAGFTSQRWSGVRAEGLVLKPTVELCDRGGTRVVTKIKHRDFR